MKKKDILIEKIKCPYCKKKIELAVELEIGVKKISPYTDLWVKIKKAEYNIEDQVNFSDVDNPIQPNTWHDVAFVEKNGPGWKDYGNCSFSQGNGVLSKVGLWAETKAKYESGQWIWKVKLKPDEIPP